MKPPPAINEVCVPNLLSLHSAQWPKWRGQKELSGNDKFESSALIFQEKYFM